MTSAARQLPQAPQPAPPWERQPWDTPKEWAAFTVYRDLGQERSLVRTAEALGRTRQLIADWSSRYNWVQRAGAWDAEQDRLRLVAQQREVVAMAQRHARSAMAAQNAAMVPVTALLERLRSSTPVEMFEGTDEEGNPLVTNRALLNVALEAIRTLPASQAAERLARGEPTEIVQQQGVTGLVVAGPVGVERLRAVLDALEQAGIPIGPEPVVDDPDAPVLELEVAPQPEYGP